MFHLPHISHSFWCVLGLSFMGSFLPKLYPSQHITILINPHPNFCSPQITHSPVASTTAAIRKMPGQLLRALESPCVWTSESTFPFNSTPISFFLSPCKVKILQRKVIQNWKKKVIRWLIYLSLDFSFAVHVCWHYDIIFTCYHMQ